MPSSLCAFAVLSALLATTACAPKNQINVVSSPYADGVTHTEPVFYNGKHYDVSFRFNAHANAYEVTVAGKGGRPLAAGDGDRVIVEAIGTSTVRHFACATGHKSAVVPGTTRHAAGRWDMRTRCG